MLPNTNDTHDVYNNDIKTKNHIHHILIIVVCCKQHVLRHFIATLMAQHSGWLVAFRKISVICGMISWGTGYKRLSM